MIDFETCVKTGLLKPVPPSRERALQSLAKASAFLQEAEADFRDERIASTILLGYAAAFNAAKALLYRDGYRERSHACVAKFLRARYGKKLPADLVDLFEHYISVRHAVQYSLEHTGGSAEARGLLGVAKKLVAEVGKLL